MEKKDLMNTVWTLVSYESQDKEGNIIFPLGPDAKGYISFVQGDILSVQIMKDANDTTLTEAFIDRMNTENEQEMARNGYHAYAGPFSFDEETSILKTQVQVSLIEDYVGSGQERKAELKGDTLHLSNIRHPERRLVWKKLVTTDN